VVEQRYLAVISEGRTVTEVAGTRSSDSRQARNHHVPRPDSPRPL